MLIELEDSALVADLCDHYTRSGFTAEPVGGRMVEVGRPDAADPDRERHEVLMHLRVWALIHPDAGPRILP
jgi:hypothetical protein